MSPDFFREHDDKPRIFGATQLKKQPSYTKQAFAINRFFSAINRFFFFAIKHYPVPNIHRVIMATQNAGDRDN
jgi:hypothetical protein